MIGNIFKNIGKGIGYFFLFPGLLIAIAIYAVFGLIVFIYQFFKLIFLFFTGRTLFSDLPEDTKVKAILDDKVNGGSEKSEEAPAQPKPQEESQSSTQTAPVYTSYATLYPEANVEPENKPTTNIEPELIEEEIPSKINNNEGGDQNA